MRLRIATIAIGLLLAVAPFAQQAEAARGDSRSEARSSQSRARSAVHVAGTRRPARGARAGASSGYGGISCVPYARGQRPQVGSVLSFPSSGGMRSGHVAVVSRIVQPRVIEIDHANWGGPGIRRGTVMHNVRVIDVSDDNSWTRVRVQVGWDSTTFGREYPTDGFIHNRAASSYIAGADDMVRPVSYMTRSEIRTPRTARHAESRPSRSGRAPQAETRSARRTQDRAVSARTGQPTRLASARTTR